METRQTAGGETERHFEVTCVPYSPASWVFSPLQPTRQPKSTFPSATSLAAGLMHSSGRKRRFEKTIHLEVLKEAAGKITRVAVLWDPRQPGTVHEIKEQLPTAARELKLILQPWEVRDSADLEKVFAALNKQRPDALYVPGGALLINNRKRIVDFALKSRLDCAPLTGEKI